MEGGRSVKSIGQRCTWFSTREIIWQVILNVRVELHYYTLYAKTFKCRGTETAKRNVPEKRRTGWVPQGAEEGGIRQGVRTNNRKVKKREETTRTMKNEAHSVRLTPVRGQTRATGLTRVIFLVGTDR